MSKVALLTGFSSLLGQEVVKQLLNKGYVVYAGARKFDNNSISNVIPITLDVTSDSSCSTAIKKIQTNHDHLDVLINLAGLTLNGPFWSFSSQDYKDILDINTIGTFRLIKASLPLLQKSTKPLIINISSLNSFLASPNFALYSSSKFALDGFSQAAAIELSTIGVKLITVAPGAIKSTSSSKAISHKTARERFPVLKWLLPLTTIDSTAQKIVSLTQENNSSSLVLIGRDSKMIYMLQKYLPRMMWNHLQTWLWQRQK